MLTTPTHPHTHTPAPQFRKPMIIAGAIKGLNDISQFAWPLILLQFLEFLENHRTALETDPNASTARGWMLCFVSREAVRAWEAARATPDLADFSRLRGSSRDRRSQLRFFLTTS